MFKSYSLQVPTVILLSLVLLVQIACNEGANTEEKAGFDIRTSIKSDPSFLFPTKSMANTEVEINQYIFLPLANYHPHTLELIPILLQEIPKGVEILEGEFEGNLRFDCQIKEDAKWDDGSDISGYDYLFTIKSIKIKEIKTNPSLKSVFSQMNDVEVNEEDPKRFSIYVNEGFHLARELAIMTEVMPEYIYDSLKILRNYQIEKAEIIAPQDQTEEQKTAFKKEVEFLNHADCGRKIVVGSGPYALKEWQTKLFVRLEKKKLYWGNKYPNNPYLKAVPENIFFNIFPDMNAALTALQSGELDLIGNLSGIEFERIRKNERIASNFNYLTAKQLKYHFLAINNHSEILSDIKVRKALAHIIDVETLLQNQELGYGERVAGPIVPEKSYYNDTLKLIPFDLQKTKDLLKDAGWKDSDNTGLLSKKINGKETKLKLRMHITGNVLGKNLALILKEKAKSVGMEIEIFTKDRRSIRNDIAARDFDLYPTGTGYGLYPDDLFQSWHSSNDFPGGSNKYGYNNPKADEIMEKIRKSDDKNELNNLYKQLQELIYHDQPLIFLYAPTNNIVIKKIYHLKATIKKPGYFINEIEIAD